MIFKLFEIYRHFLHFLPYYRYIVFILPRRDHMSFSPKVGEKAPYFNTNSAFGPIQLTDYEGKWLILCFHKAGPSPIYDTDFSHFSSYSQKLSALNTDVLCITSKPDTLTLLARGGVHRLYPVENTIPVILDERNSISKLYNVNSDYTRGNQNSDRTIFIINPNQDISAILYYPIISNRTVNAITNIISTLQTGMRPEIHQANNPPYINPDCPNLAPIAGEYVLGNPNDVDTSFLDFVIYAFALINPDGTLQPYSTKYLQDLANLRIEKPDLKVIMAIGGWGADGFSDAALTPQSRYAFAREAKKWVDEYNLDGIDIDWEYPGSSASGIKSRKEDKENFTLLIQALRDVLGDDAWISVAGSGDAAYINNVEIAKIAPLITYFNIMAYDFTAGETGANAAKHQANLFPSSLALNNTYSVDRYVKNLIDAGMPSTQLLLGIPYYGRFGATITRTYDELRKSYINKNGYKVKWDNEAKAPYLVDRYGNFAMSYDNILSIYFKGLYIYQNCLGGMFAWHSGMDRANLLSKAMYEAVKFPEQLEEELAKSYSGQPQN